MSRGFVMNRSSPHGDRLAQLAPGVGSHVIMFPFAVALTPAHRRGRLRMVVGAKHCDGHQGPRRQARQ